MLNDNSKQQTQETVFKNNNQISKNVYPQGPLKRPFSSKTNNGKFQAF